MREVKSAVVFAPKWNTDNPKTARKERDATGVFQPEARAWMELHNVPDDRLLIFDNRQPRRRQLQETQAFIESVVRGLQPGEQIDSVVLFCHGFRVGVQPGWNVRNIDQVVETFQGRLTDDCVWVYYSCSTGRGRRETGGDGGFADMTRDSLAEHYCTHARVMGHTTVAHSTKAPHARFFDGDGTEEPQEGGEYVVPPGHELWPLWRAELRDTDDPDGALGPEPASSLRWRFPWMDIDEVHAWLREYGDVAPGFSAQPGLSVPVLALQEALVKAGIDPGPTDGVMGPRTRRAVKAYQAANPPLEVDGRFGPKTRASMRGQGLLT